MPSLSQMIRLTLLSLALWIVATLYIRLQGQALADPLQGAIGFLTAPIGGWLSVRLAKACGRLAADQLLPGVALVGAVAMMIDGVALRWLPDIYGSEETVVRLGAAWLLWGYGVALAIALLMARREVRAV